ncbi:hypothetical protein V8E55_009949 [Tylopilus felleus]
MSAGKHDEAISHYSTALSFNSVIPLDVFMKRSKVYMAMGLWDDAMQDAKKVTVLNRSSSWGYERVLMEWAKVSLTDWTWRDALKTARGFKAPIFAVYQALCERLDTLDNVMDVTKCFHDMESNLPPETNSEQAKWIAAFKSRCGGKLEEHGDLAMNTGRRDEAISHYSHI